MKATLPEAPDSEKQLLFVDRDRELKEALVKLKDASEGGEAASLDAAKLFFQIQSQELYKGVAKTITEYGRLLKVSKEQTSRWVASGSVYQDLLDAGIQGMPLATNESQLRPLVKLRESAARIQAWTQAVALAEGAVPTAKQVERIVKDSPIIAQEISSTECKKEKRLLQLDFSNHPVLWRYLMKEAESREKTIENVILDLIDLNCPYEAPVLQEEEEEEQLTPVQVDANLEVLDLL